MNTKLLIATDLGLMGAYRGVLAPHYQKFHWERIEELEPHASHKKRSGQVVDQAGRAPRGKRAGKIPSERLKVEAVETRRQVTHIAERINVQLSVDEVASCSPAASVAIHKQLFARFNLKARGKINKDVASDLAKTEANELLEHFARKT